MFNIPVTLTFPIISTSDKYILSTYNVQLNAENTAVNETDILMRGTISKQTNKIRTNCGKCCNAINMVLQ